MPLIRVKRVYDAPAEDDGYRILVDKLWPRGISWERSRVDLWLKDIAPSDELRRWFNHEPEKWAEFKKRYFTEIKERTEALGSLLEKLKTERVTLLYGARDQQLNNATALKEYLENEGATGHET